MAVALLRPICDKPSSLTAPCQPPIAGHNHPAMTFLRRFLLALIFFATISGASAQGKLHASHKVAEKYLKAIHLHQWKEAVDLVESKSLDNLKTFQKAYLLKAPTMEEEQNLLRLLNMADISDMDTMTAKDVFIRRGQAKTKRLVDAKGHIAQMKKSLVMKTLGTVPEGTDTVHVVIRKEFTAEEKAFSELAFVSVVKEGTVWKISLDAQEPKVFNIKDKKK
jgi:hypothetical protein